MSLYPLQDSFVRGELSPRLHSRAGLDLYRSGLSKCVNFIPLPHGGLRKRGGTYFVNEVKDSDVYTIGIPFIFNNEQAYFLELGQEYIRFYAYSAQIVDGSDVPIESDTSYLEDELPLVRYAQSADVMWLAMANWPVQTLTRFDNDEWETNEKEFEDGPFAPQNIDEDITMYVSDVDGDITITASEDAFTEDMVGQLIKIEMASYEDISPWEAGALLAKTNEGPLGQYIRYEGNVYICVTDPNDHFGEPGINGTPPNCSFDHQVRAGGTPPTHTTPGQVERDGQMLDDPEFAASAGAWFGVEWEYVHSGFGIARIEDVADPQNASATVLTTFPDELAAGEDGASFMWSIGSYGGSDGYPDTAFLFEERLGFSQRLTVDLSKTGDFDSFKIGEKDDDALQFLQAGVGGANQIVWTADADGFLALGTIGGVRSLSGSGVDEALTPSSFKNRNSRTFGCAPIAPVSAGTSFLYVSASRQALIELTLSQNLRFQAQDVGQVNEHIPKSGIVNLAFQTYPDPICWFPLENGELGSFTYQPSQEVRGMARHHIAGFAQDIDDIGDDDGYSHVEWATVTPQTSGGDDLWLNVRRTVSEAPYRSIEVMKNPLEYVDIENAFYVDCGLSYNGSPATVFSGLGHLDGQSVSALADGKVYRGLTVIAGSVTLPVAASEVHIGLPYLAQAITLELDVGAKDGSLMGRRKRVSKVILSVMETDISCLEVSAHTPDLWEKVKQVHFTPDDPGSTPPGTTSEKRVLVSGTLEIPIEDRWQNQGKIQIRHSDPTPCTLRGIIPVFEAEP